MRLSLVIAVSLLGLTSASAAELHVKLNNRSAAQITSVMATAYASPPETTQSVLVSPINPGEDGALQLTADDSACLFTLAITFSSGDVTERPDLDLCQTDQIMIE